MSWLARVTTVCAACVASADAQGLNATRPRHTVVGVVTDSLGAALVNADVRLLVAGIQIDAMRTADSGRFIFTADMSGASRLQVRRIGFHPREIELRFPRDSSRPLRIVLDPAPVRLTEVAVVENPTEVAGWLSEFETRRRANSFGRFYTRDAIKSAIAIQPSEVLRMIPGVQLVSVRRGGYAIRMRNCKFAPIVWVDGMRAPRSELDEVVNLQDIAAMEVYTSSAGVPAQFMDRSNSGCGTIVVWTRHQ